jgi:hypothetical protein
VRPYLYLLYLLRRWSRSLPAGCIWLIYVPSSVQVYRSATPRVPGGFSGASSYYVHTVGASTRVGIWVLFLYLLSRY